MACLTLSYVVKLYRRETMNAAVPENPEGGKMSSRGKVHIEFTAIKSPTKRWLKRTELNQFFNSLVKVWTEISVYDQKPFKYLWSGMM